MAASEPISGFPKNNVDCTIKASVKGKQFKNKPLLPSRPRCHSAADKMRRNRPPLGTAHRCQPPRDISKQDLGISEEPYSREAIAYTERHLL